MLPVSALFLNRRLFLLAALAALLAAAALAVIPRADAQTPSLYPHIVRWDPGANSGAGAPIQAVNGRFAYDEDDDIYIKVWVTSAAVTAGAVPAASVLNVPYHQSSGSIDFIVVGFRYDDPDASTPDIISGGDHRIPPGGDGYGGAMHEYGLQAEDDDGDFVDFLCPDRWGGGMGNFGLPCGAGNGVGPGGKARFLGDPDHASAGNADTAGHGGVFKLVLPPDLDNFYVSAIAKANGEGTRTEHALRFVSPDYREVSVYRMKDTDDGLAPCTSEDTSVDDCTDNPELGRALLMGSILSNGNDADGNPVKVPYSDFDTVEVEIKSSDRLNNAGIVFHPDLCPVSSPPVGAGVESPFVDAWRSGNDQLGICTYNKKSFGDTSGNYDGTVGPFVNYLAGEIRTPPSSAWATDGIVYVRYMKGETEVASGQYQFASPNPANAFSKRRDNDADTPDVNEAGPQGRIGAYGSSGDLALRIGLMRETSLPASAIDGEYMTTVRLSDFQTGGSASNADRITLNVKGKGTVRLLYTDWECSDDGTTDEGTDCHLNDPDGADPEDRLGTLMQAMLRGRTLETGYGWDLMHMTPMILRVVHDTENPEDITLSGRIKDGTFVNNPIPEYVAKAPSGNGEGSARVIAWLPDDADGRLGASQVAQVAVGYHAQDEATQRFHGSVSGFWYATAYEGLDATLGSGGIDLREQGFGDGYLVLNGPAVWDENGGKRLSLSEEGYNHINCVDRRGATGSADDAGLVSCYMTNEDGGAPKVRVDADAGDDDIVVTGNVPVWRLTADDPTASVPEGSVPAFYELPTGTMQYQGVMAFGQARLRVGAVKQIETVTLSRAPVGGVVPTGTIRVGDPEAKAVVLSIRNAENAPSQITALSAITISVIGGGQIDGGDEEGRGDYCPGSFAPTCTVSFTSMTDGGTAADSLRVAAGATPGVIGAIPLRFKAPTTAGNTRIVATVIGNDGSTYSAEPLELVISGTASSIAVSGDEPRLLSFDTPDSGDAKDDRDTATIKIGASDAAGNAAAMPRNAKAELKSAAGAAVPSSAYVATIDCANPERTNCSLVININQSAAAPLASGDYIAKVSGSGIADLDVPVTLAGKAKTINVELGELPGVGGNWPVTIAVLDSNGIPVADGTEVRLDARGVVATTSDVVLISKPNEDSDGVASAKTKNGMVSANLTVIARGRGVLSVSAVSGSGDSLTTDATSGGVVLDTRTAALPDEAYGGPIEFQSADGMPALGVISSWRGETAGSASQALALVEGADVLWLHNGRRWIQYATGPEGAELPGSAANFTIIEGDYLWFAASQ